MKTPMLILLLLTAGCSRIAAEISPRSSETVLAEMKAACGGETWARVQGWHETGVADLPGQPGMPYEIWHDMRTLKTAMINRVDGRIVRHAGFNGSEYWQVARDGRVTIGRDPAVIRRQRRDAYLSSAGWFFRDRFPATIMLAGSETRDGRVHDVLRFTPQHADSFDLWIARDTHRISRIVAGNEHAELADYRMFDGVCSATTGRQGDGNPAHDIILHVQAVETDAVVPAATFEPPLNSTTG